MNEITRTDILEAPVDAVYVYLKATEIFVRIGGQKHRLYLGLDGRYYYYWSEGPNGLEVRPLGAAE
jgi:hypothetical protein